MVIKKINKDEIESYLKNISEGITQIKLLQEEIENLNNNLKNNKSDFLSGKISREIYKDIKINLDKEKKDLTNKTNKTINNVLILSEELSKIISNNKI